jgi:hypothetical protein
MNEGLGVLLWNLFCLLMVILYVRYDVKNGE